MRTSIQIGLLLVALLLATPAAAAESANERIETALATAQQLIQARTNDVRELRKATDEFVDQLNKLSRSNAVKFTPEFKRELAQKRLYYYSRLSTLNADAVELEQTLPNKVAPNSRQKVLDLLARLRDELRFTVVSLNHVARSLKEL